MLTVLDADREVTVPSDGLLIAASDLPAATGWTLKPQGLCRDDECVPTSLTEPLSLLDVAAALRRPIAHAAIGDDVVAVLGEPAGTTVAVGDVVPPLSLTDVDGNAVTVSGTGRRTVVATWATWCGCRHELPAWKQLADQLRGVVDVVTVALDDDADTVRPWVPEGLTTAVDPEHRVSDVLGVVQVPSSVWLDEQGRVVKPPTISPGDDQFIEWTKVEADRHHDALREWARGGEVPAYGPGVPDDEPLRTARAERRLAAWLHRNGHAEAAEEHFDAAVALAPLDFSIRRSSMPLRGQDPFFGEDFLALWQEWDAAGRPGYTVT